MASPTVTKAPTTLVQSLSFLIQLRGHCNALPVQIIASNHEPGTIAGMLYRATAPGTRLTATNGTAIHHPKRGASRRMACSETVGHSLRVDTIRGGVEHSSETRTLTCDA